MAASRSCSRSIDPAIRGRSLLSSSNNAWTYGAIAISPKSSPRFRLFERHSWDGRTCGILDAFIRASRFAAAARARRESSPCDLPRHRDETLAHSTAIRSHPITPPQTWAGSVLGEIDNYFPVKKPSSRIAFMKTSPLAGMAERAAARLCRRLAVVFIQSFRSSLAHGCPANVEFRRLRSLAQRPWSGQRI